MGWYEDNIEEGIREIVQYLRDNGINTEASCAHDMSVQFQIPKLNTIEQVFSLLEIGGFKEYQIEIKIIRNHESLDITGIIYFPCLGLIKYPVQTKRESAAEQSNLKEKIKGG